jgi:hypothetical protein
MTTISSVKDLITNKQENEYSLQTHKKRKIQAVNETNLQQTFWARFYLETAWL